MGIIFSEPIKKETPAQVLSYEFYKISKNSFFTVGGCFCSSENHCHKQNMRKKKYFANTNSGKEFFSFWKQRTINFIKKSVLK